VLPSRSLALALAAVCAVTLAGCGKKQPVEPPHQGASFVALGDSFTAVAGTGPFTDPTFCARSTHDYPRLVAEKMHLTSFADVSCGGASPLNLTQAQVVSGVNGTGTNQPQLDALSTDTTLVTVGIGLNATANGIPISYLATELCGPKNVNDTKCTAYQQVADSDWAGVIDDMGDQVADGIKKIRQRAPDARIVLVGYPRVLPDQGACTKQVPLPGLALKRLRTTLRLTDHVLRKAAADEDADYIDMYTASAGHDACSADPWVNGYRDVKGKAYAYHPFASYHRAVAEKIVALLRTKKPQA